MPTGPAAESNTRAPVREANQPAIAILVPCHNEGPTIGRVIDDFQAALPAATIYVYDNNSQDDTVAEAQGRQAVLRHEKAQGKGNVVRRMFADIDADVYVLVDGDATYEASVAPQAVECLTANGLDMVNVAREPADEGKAYRPGHRLGNRVFTGIVANLFGRTFKDLLSGYRVFSRRFVKSFPSSSGGFEIETELTVHALQMGLPVDEISACYRERPSGSQSKLRTFRDGARILRAIVLLLKTEKPFLFFASIGGALFALALALSVPLFLTYFQTGLVPRFPTAVLCTGLTLMAALSLVCGLILDNVGRVHRDMKRLHYLAWPRYWPDRR